MRKFSSYGPIINTSNYYAPREELIEKTYINLIGENPAEGGHYFTVWAPRQTGKTWLMQQVVQRIKQEGKYDVAMISLQAAKTKKDEQKVLEIFLKKVSQTLQIRFPKLSSISDISDLFTRDYFQKPLVLIIDEFDSLEEEFMKLFQTGEKQELKFDDKTLNALYMNGLVDYEIENRTDYYVKFSCPFVQKRLFNYFSN